MAWTPETARTASAVPARADPHPAPRGSLRLGDGIGPGADSETAMRRVGVHTRHRSRASIFNVIGFPLAVAMRPRRSAVVPPAPDPRAGGPARLGGLDALRGVAATAVMLFHYHLWFLEVAKGPARPVLMSLFLTGQFGVELFFIVSGFVIFMSLERSAGLAAFALARIVRLWPTFLACMGVTLLVPFALGDPAPPGQIWDVLASATMLPHLFGFRGIDGSYWTLLYEIDFYTLAGICVLGLGWKAPEIPCAVWLAIATGVRLSGAHGLVEEVSCARFAHLFVAGIMLYRLHAGQRTSLTLPLLLLTPILSAGGPAWYSGSLPVWAYMLTIACLVGVVWFAPSRAGRARPLLFLGRISYPLYLVHATAGFSVLPRLRSVGLGPDASIVVTSCLAIAVATLISNGIEIPVRRWFRARRSLARRPRRLVDNETAA
jgi:peptidoglycan/LPS O-acetylase OafA/YrhL